MGRIGIYGGTFNPPHIGHIRAARSAAAALGLDKLLLVPSHISPHKTIPEGSPGPEQRYEMLRLACREDPVLTVSDVELKRGDVSFTFETVEQLKAEYPDEELVFLMGTDMFCSFHTWRNPERIIKNASLGVFYRGIPEEREAVTEQKQRLTEMGARVYLIDHPVTRISSTDLRRLMVFDCAGEYLPEGVGEYIRQAGLYGMGSSCRGLSEKELEQKVLSLLKPDRTAHVLGCRDTAEKLAERWGADRDQAVRAALLHDITKALDGPLQLTLCSRYGIILDNFKLQNPQILHALTGSAVARDIFGEEPEVVRAIAFHTTGRENMTTLEKIIYVADYMEPGRVFPGVEKLRSLAWEDLDRSLELGLQMTIDLLRSRGKAASPESEQALMWLKSNNVP